MAGEVLLYQYKMHHPEKSICLVINMENFDRSLYQSRRDGTDKDMKSLKHTFKHLGFEVRTEKDVTYMEIKTILETVSAEDHSKRSCFVCVVLSHGDENGLFARDCKFTLQWLVEFFSEENCKSLAGKPKLFFIQACRGNDYDEGVETDSGSHGNTTMNIPLYKDCLYSYSTPPGYFAWRNNVYGSWFIQSLCKMLKEHGKKLELIQILTRVNNRVAFEYETCHGRKEMPYFVSMLTKEFYLLH
ncbi:caspase-3-like isoform 2-T2 [Discoglossus pictus]